VSGHVLPLRVYAAIFAALLVLTAVTVWVSGLDLGALNTPVALAIATLKAVLVLLWFMHVRYSKRLTWVFVIAGFFWLGIMLVLTFSDYLTRHWVAVYS
jgi:cytochrome c oxidase subunit 4